MTETNTETTPISGIFPPTQTLTLSDGRVFEIKPFTFGQMADAARALGAVGSVIAMVDIIGLMTALVEAGEPAVKLVQMATSMTQEQVLALPQDDGIAVLAAVLEVNADFFARRVITAMTRLLNVAMKALTPDPGEKPAFQDMTAATAEPSATAGHSAPLH